MTRDMDRVVQRRPAPLMLVANSEGIWVVRGLCRIGPLTDLGEIFDALGPPTPHTEDLADMDWEWLQIRQRSGTGADRIPDSPDQSASTVLHSLRKKG